MDVTAGVDTPGGVDALFRWVSDLGLYTEWLDIVVRATPANPASGDAGPAWIIDLRGHLGPLARSKRLRMVRTLHEPPNRAAFERKEVDGRRHAPWVLRASVASTPDGSRLTMRLHYGGTLWGPVLERLLTDEIERSRPRLVRLVEPAPRSQVD
jgi:Polyketide cyclase / dehydrase and lipid transport